MIDRFKRHLEFYSEGRYWQNYFARARPSMFYVGAAQSANLGDDLLYRASCRLFDRVSLLPPAPQVGEVDHDGLGRLHVLMSRGIYGGFSAPKATMLGGGTLLNDPHFFSKLRQYHTPRTDLFVFGSGLRDPDTEGNYLEEQVSLLRKARIVGVRDVHARDWLHTFGVEAEIIGDPVLSLGGPDGGHEQRLSGRTIGVNVGFNGTQYGDQPAVLRVTAELARELAGRGWGVQFFVLDPSDADQVARVRRESGLRDAPLWTVEHHGTRTMLAAFAGVTLMVGQRLHAAVTACAVGRPAVSLAYRSKCVSFMESMGLGEYAVRTDTVSTDRLLGMVEEIEDDYDSIRESLVTARDTYAKKQRDMAERIMTMLARP